MVPLCLVLWLCKFGFLLSQYSFFMARWFSWKQLLPPHNKCRGFNYYSDNTPYPLIALWLLINSRTISIFWDPPYNMGSKSQKGDFSPYKKKTDHWTSFMLMSCRGSAEKTAKYDPIFRNRLVNMVVNRIMKKCIQDNLSRAKPSIVAFQVTKKESFLTSFLDLLVCWRHLGRCWFWHLWSYFLGYQNFLSFLCP
jgi:hypothetical protein